MVFDRDLKIGDVVYEVEYGPYNYRFRTLKDARTARKATANPARYGILKVKIVGRPGTTGSEEVVKRWGETQKITTKKDWENVPVSPWSRSLRSKAMSINAAQAEQFNEDAKRHGTGARYCPKTGDAFFDSRRSRAAEMRRRGMFDKQAGFGDFAGDNNTDPRNPNVRLF